METPEEFITAFHSLEGTSLREKKKSFHSLLVRYKNASPDTLDTIVQRLTPTTYLEDTFKIELLINFHRNNDLLNILITGNEIGTCKVIRQKWFIEFLMEKYTPIEFVKELFPQLALSVRTKILKRVLVNVKDETKIQEIFEILYQIYGWQVASVLLPGCSDEKIKEILKKNTACLSVPKLKLLFDKDKALIDFYFQLLKNNDECVDNYRWRSLFNYMAIKDPIFSSEFSKKFDIYFSQYGRQTTKKFIEAKKDEILDKPDKYTGLLRNDAMVRKLGEDFPKFFKKGLPKNISNLSYCSVRRLLKYYDKSKQYELYFNAFKETYNKSLWDNIEYMDEQLIELISDKNEREEWIKKFDNRANYMKYTNNFIRKKCAMMQCSAMVFDDDMGLSDENAISERKTIFNTLISTCKLNQDYDAFLNILKSFCQRHRNSDVTILYNFLRSIYNELDMKKLNDEHWKHINEIINVQLFKKQQLFYPILLEYVKYLYLQQKPIEETVLTMLKEIPKSLVDLKYDNDEFEKAMLLLYIKLYSQVKDVENVLALQIILSVMKWNEKHSTDAISLHDQQNILDVFTKLKDTKKAEPKMMKAFKYLICRQSENVGPSQLDEIYWENFKVLNDKTITRWFLKYKPEVLKNHLDKIGIILKDKNVNLVRNLKKYDHMDIPNDITKLCLQELEDAEPSKRERVIKILVFFMPSKEFLTFFKQHIPTGGKVDIASGDEDVRKTYEIQCALAKNLKSTLILKEALPDLLKYCQGDVLGSALPSLYSSFHRISVKELYFALEELSTKAVSVRKHASYLSSLILPVDEVLLKYKNIQSENNKSVKQAIFLSCYKYFVNNYLPECWPILVEYIDQLKKEQKDVLKILTRVNQVPKEYRAVCTEHVWTILNKLKKENVKLDENMKSLLRMLEKQDVIALQNEFCIKIIENNLFDLDECSMEDSVFDFTKKFLLHGGHTEHKITCIFKVLHVFKEKFWNDDKNKLDALKVVNKFCFDLFKDLLEKNKDKEKDNFDKNFPKLFCDAWTNEFTIEETFEENLLMNFVLLLNEPELESESLPGKVNKAFSLALEKYGNLIISSFKNFISSSLHLICKDTDYNLYLINFLEGFLEHNCSPEHCALVIELLPEGYMEEEAKQAYKSLVGKLLQKNEIVKICLFGKLKSGYY